MSSEQAKGESEIAVFVRFVHAAKLAIDMQSIEKRSPPEPDILCRYHTEGRVAFELVELCDPTLAKAMANADESYLRTADPSPRILAKKLRRSYATDAPIELLCYTAGRIVTPDSTILPMIEPSLRSGDHIFRRAWLLGRQGVHVVWQAG